MGKKRRIRVVLCVLSALVVLTLLGWRGYRAVVPAGVENGFAYCYGSYDRGVFVSPDGRRRVLVRTNDPGATRVRDDLNYTWVVEDDWLTGKRVVAGGYLPFTSDPPDPQQIPLQWIDDDTFQITFMPDPKTHTSGGTITVDLD